MEPITVEQLMFLVKLQSIEIDIKGIKARIEGISGKIEALDAELHEFEQVISGAESGMSEARKKYRGFESDLEVNLAQIKKSNEKLRAVKTNKEYQSMLKEIDEIKQINSRIEDEMIGSLDEIDSAERFLTQKKAEYERVKDQIREDRETVRRESEENRNRLSALEAEWKEIAESVVPGLLKTYRTIRSKSDIAIAAVQNSVCQGCHLNIPPQMYNELQRLDNLKFCPHCQRIIYWKELLG
ncbi:MAG: hypothetical protein C4530_09835 [Desulfobacteraceae bacterium]|nr:MAG: hypothetical protein C4530_09835 [Desulfobacteraceae bacterium]